MNYKTTKNNYAEFKKECEYWIKYFGIMDWEINYKHKNYEDARAWAMWNYEGRTGTIGLSIDWLNFEPTNYLIKKSAFHEVLEIMMGSLQDIASCRSFDSGEYQKEKHAVIRRLENTVFREKRK